MVSYIEDRDYLLQDKLVALQRGIVSCELAGGHVGGTEASVLAALHNYLKINLFDFSTFVSFSNTHIFNKCVYQYAKLNSTDSTIIEIIATRLSFK